MDVRCIQELLGPNAAKTTGRYTYASNKSLANIKNPLEHIIEQQGIDNERVTVSKA